MKITIYIPHDSVLMTGVKMRELCEVWQVK